MCCLSTGKCRWTGAHWDDSTNVHGLPIGQDQLVMLFVQWSCEYLAAPNSAYSLERDNGERDRCLQGLSCNMGRARSRSSRVVLQHGQSPIEASSDFVNLNFWELVGCDELEPLVQASPFEHFQMTFVAIPVNQ